MGCLGVVPYQNGLVSSKNLGMYDRIRGRAVMKGEKVVSQGMKVT